MSASLSSSPCAALLALIVLSFLVLQETIAIGNTNIFPHVHKKPEEAKELSNNFIVADESDGEHYLAFFSRGTRRRKNAVVDACRSIEEPMMKNSSKPVSMHPAYDSAEEEMIERLVETQD
jgi:hypothetical protein